MGAEGRFNLCNGTGVGKCFASLKNWKEATRTAVLWMMERKEEIREHMTS